MMGHLGFSYVGVIYLAMLIIPNIIWTKHQPTGYNPTTENRLLLCFERIGQVLCFCIVLVFEDFNLRPWTSWSLWLAVSFLLMALYDFWWIRYFRSPKNLADFYSSLLGIPLAGATLPVTAFALLGIYGRVIWLVLAAGILGVGHIGIHMQHYRNLPLTDIQ